MFIGRVFCFFLRLIRGVMVVLSKNGSNFRSVEVFFVFEVWFFIVSEKMVVFIIFMFDIIKKSKM